MKAFAFLLLAALAASSTACSNMSRQERAYAKYIRKSSVARQKQQTKFRTGQPQMPTMPMPSEPVESTAIGPEVSTPGDG